MCIISMLLALCILGLCELPVYCPDDDGYMHFIVWLYARTTILVNDLSNPINTGCDSMVLLICQSVAPHLLLILMEEQSEPFLLNCGFKKPEMTIIEVQSCLCFQVICAMCLNLLDCYCVLRFVTCIFFL